MGQNEVYEWLKYQRVTLKRDDYFSAREIAKAMNGGTTEFSLKSIGGDLPRLMRFGYLEWRIGYDVSNDKLTIQDVVIRSAWNIRYRYKIQKK